MPRRTRHSNAGKITVVLSAEDRELKRCSGTRVCRSARVHNVNQIGPDQTFAATCPRDF